ncbi:hypothetical protein [Microbacterium xylanilyticum]
MTNNPQMPLVPEDPEQELSDPPLMEDADGDEELDPDRNDDHIDSAEADRIASETDDDLDDEDR